jgi:sugar/nucleoside kinase (ribokinase family)
MNSTESQQTSFDVVVVGDLNADLILQGNCVPTFGQVEKLVDDATLTLGSSAGIFACGAARLGMRVAFVGKVGDDTFGHFVIQQLAERGVDTGGIICDPTLKTGLTVILSRGPDRAILTYLGSIEQLTYQEIDWAYLQGARHLHLASYFLLNKLKPDIPDLFQTAHDQGMTVSLDTNYDPTEQWDLADKLRHIDVFLPNEVELCAIVKQPNSDLALESLSHQVPIVAVKLGSRGASLVADQRIVRVGVPPVEVVDTTGAGDTFDAGFIYGYLRGWSLEDILRFAAICGSLSTQAIGGVGGQPTLEEAQHALSEVGWLLPSAGEA